jgi:hypothetical protein
MQKQFPDHAMPYRTCLLFLFLVFSIPARADASSLELGCDDPRSKGVEAKLIRNLANRVVLRKSLHELQVEVAGKTLRFKDEPPHDEPFAGVHYHFCDRKEDFILLFKEDGFQFTGSLINEKTGQITPGGERVTFSHDRRAYMTSEQPDGLDGEVWKILAIDGRLSWEGFSFIPNEKDSSHMDATLDKQQWTVSGEFTAVARCITNPDQSWNVTLKKIGGKWDWHPKKKCAKSK